MNGLTINTPYSSYYNYPAAMTAGGDYAQNTLGAGVTGSGRSYENNAASVERARGDKTQRNEAFGVKRKSSPEECQTCKERKYQDGSNENVSFKSAAHISPEAAGARVRAHESEHVANAYSDAKEKDGKVIRASVSIHTSVCPECGRTFVSGGTTNTMIKYSDESNPYQKNQKSLDAARFVGNNVDYVA